MSELTIGSKQHCACWPMAAQMLVKSSTSVGVLGGLAQLRSAKSRTLVAQHWGVESVPGQTVAWRGLMSAGRAATMVAPASRAVMIENCMLDRVCFLLI